MLIIAESIYSVRYNAPVTENELNIWLKYSF